MSLVRLDGIDPGRIGVFAGPLNAQPASVQREFVREMEQLGYGTLWYGESLAREAFAQGGIYLAATRRLVIASGIAIQRGSPPHESFGQALKDSPIPMLVGVSDVGARDPASETHMVKQPSF